YLQKVFLLSFRRRLSPPPKLGVPGDQLGQIPKPFPQVLALLSDQTLINGFTDRVANQVTEASEGLQKYTSFASFGNLIGNTICEAVDQGLIAK
ncbi:MAG: hypothetical protein EBY15_00305, partial [Gammaproteobacteria bacterium]|nr:hypothetical protein [Gammaproteobacteria bacterium]